MSKLKAFIIALLLVCSTALADDVPFRQVTGGMRLEYPRDHGSHPEFATEWWYFTGHLETEDGRMLGFELVFFRIGVNPRSDSRSAWALQSLFLSHFALTDDAAQSFQSWERKSRGSFNQAGAAEGELKVWNGPWTAQLKDGVVALRAAQDALSLELSLRPAKPIVLHGDNGLSRKGPGDGEASYYASFTRLSGQGELKRGAVTSKIKRAQIWFDQEFTSSRHARNDLGWDWFAIQLDNNQELMVYQLRDADGRKSGFSSGTFVDETGKTEHLQAEQFTIEPLKSWSSSRSGIRYPAKWRITVPAIGLDGEVEPTVADQELETGSSTGVTYWEGRSRFRGSIRGETHAGNAYVELVGYGKE